MFFSVLMMFRVSPGSLVQNQARCLQVANSPSARAAGSRDAVRSSELGRAPRNPSQDVLSMSRIPSPVQLMEWLRPGWQRRFLYKIALGSMSICKGVNNCRFSQKETKRVQKETMISQPPLFNIQLPGKLPWEDTSSPFPKEQRLCGEPTVWRTFNLGKRVGCPCWFLKESSVIKGHEPFCLLKLGTQSFLILCICHMTLHGI